jgi:hypothetical protein
MSRTKEFNEVIQFILERVLWDGRRFEATMEAKPVPGDIAECERR